MDNWESTLKILPGYDPFAQAKGFEFKPELADRVVRFIEHYTQHVKGKDAGEATKLEPWQLAVVGNLFGWVDKDGVRRFREALIYVPRKNGKSYLTACLANFLFFCDNEAGAEIYCAAAEKPQAALVWNVARQQIENNASLKSRCRVLRGTSSILREDGSLFKPLSADADTKHGYNVHAALIDEIHCHKNGELFEALETGTVSRKQPLIISMTTADYARESLCNTKLKYAKSVCTGKVEDPRFLPVIYEAPGGADWKDPETWKAANPNLGVSVPMEYLERMYQKALDEPSFEPVFKRLHLNIVTEAAHRWLSSEAWKGCGEVVSDEALVGLECFGGLDLSTTTDLSAFVLYFPFVKAVKAHFWIPEDNARERELRDKVPYRLWQDQGFLTMTPGNVIDYRYIRQQINDLASQYSITEIGYDPYNARQLAIQLDQEDGIPMVEFRQGYVSMNAPCKELERLVISKQLKHGDNPVLNWQAHVAVVANDPAGNIKLDKAKATERIDGMVSLAMALGMAMAAELEPDGTSVYEERGILTL